MAKSTKRTRAGRRYPARVDARTAKRADRAAAREGLTPAELTGEAIGFWVQLPAVARHAYRALLARGRSAARRAAEREIARILRSDRHA